MRGLFGIFLTKDVTIENPLFSFCLSVCSHCFWSQLFPLVSMASLSPCPKILSHDSRLPSKVHDHSHNSNVIFRNLSLSGLGFRNSRHGSHTKMRILTSANHTEALVGEFSIFLFSYNVDLTYCWVSYGSSIYSPCLESKNLKRQIKP